MFAVVSRQLGRIFFRNLERSAPDGPTLQSESYCREKQTSFSLSLSLSSSFSSSPPFRVVKCLEGQTWHGRAVRPSVGRGREGGNTRQAVGSLTVGFVVFSMTEWADEGDAVGCETETATTPILRLRKLFHCPPSFSRREQDRQKEKPS